MFVKFLSQVATAYGYFNQDDTFYVSDPEVVKAWVVAGIVVEITPVAPAPAPVAPVVFAPSSKKSARATAEPTPVTEG